MQHPDLPLWRRLYEAVHQFKAVAPWQWMMDADLFGVRDPQTGQIGYCCILGNLGEMLGLCVYRGSAGLDVYHQTQAGQIGPGMIEAIFIQDCLMASFEDRADLDAPDLHLIKDLGFKFRGHKAWPLFRSYRPGFVPWFLEPDEVRFLTLCLEQAIDVSMRFRPNPELLMPTPEGKYLVREAEEQDGWLVWRDEWQAPEPAPSPQPIAEPPAPASDRLATLAQQTERRPVAWEFDFFMAPLPINEGERPYYPYLGLIVDHESGYVLTGDLTGHQRPLEAYQETFLKTIGQAGVRPEAVLVRRPEAETLMERLAAPLGFTLRRADHLPMLETAINHFYANIGQV